MWWIALIIVIVIIIVLVVVVVAKGINHDKGDYKDGGTQVGGNERIPFFTPANERAGMWGEKIVNYHLRPLLREDEYLLANVLLPLKNGYKTEIDCILISRKGVFCVETKNWVGHIKGNDEDEYWVQVYDDPDKKNRYHKNPITQNEGHCAILERLLNNKYSVDNVVIFANLEDGLGIDSDYAFSIRRFKEYYRKLNDDEIYLPDLKLIYQKLSKYVASDEELRQHRIDTHNRFN